MGNNEKKTKNYFKHSWATECSGNMQQTTQHSTRQHASQSQKTKTQLRPVFVAVAVVVLVFVAQGGDVGILVTGLATPN